MLANIHRFVGKKNDNNIHKRTAINIRKGAAYLNFSFRTCHTFFLYFHLVLCWNVCWPFYFFGGSILTHHSHTKYTHKKTLLIRATPQSNIQMAHERVSLSQINPIAGWYTRWYCSQWPGKKSIELCVERSSLDGEAMVLLIDSRFQSQWSFDGKAGYSHRGSRLLCALQLDSSTSVTWISGAGCSKCRLELLQLTRTRNLSKHLHAKPHTEAAYLPQSTAAFILALELDRARAESIRNTTRVWL